MRTSTGPRGVAAKEVAVRRAMGKNGWRVFADASDYLAREAAHDVLAGRMDQARESAEAYKLTEERCTRAINVAAARRRAARAAVAS